MPYDVSNSTPPSYSLFVPLPDRGPLRFPDGAQLALIITINLEYGKPCRPGQKEPLFTGGPMTIPTRCRAMCSIRRTGLGASMASESASGA